MSLLTKLAESNAAKVAAITLGIGSTVIPTYTIANPTTIVEKVEQKAEALYNCLENLKGYLSNYSSGFVEFKTNNGIHNPPIIDFASKVNKSIDKVLKNRIKLDSLDNLDAVIACQLLKKGFDNYKESWTKMANSWHGPYDTKDPLDLRDYDIFNEHQVNTFEIYRNIQTNSNILSSALGLERQF